MKRAHGHRNQIPPGSDVREVLDPRVFATEVAPETRRTNAKAGVRPVVPMNFLAVQTDPLVVIRPKRCRVEHSGIRAGEMRDLLIAQTVDDLAVRDPEIAAEGGERVYSIAAGESVGKTVSRFVGP
jgi:hypothetical protein